jgi:hypothetical protein
VKALCGKARFLAMEKSGLLVQKLWRMKLPCGKRRKNSLPQFLELIFQPEEHDSTKIVRAADENS